MTSEEQKVEKPADLHDAGRYSKQDGTPGGEPGGYTDLEAEAERRSTASGDVPQSETVAGVSESNTDDDVDSDDFYGSKTVAELHDIARERGIAYSGVKKADLVAALHDDDAE